MDNAVEIAGKLTKAQREALIACVDALSWFAGEGYEIAENGLYDLASAFDMDDGLTYEEWSRTALETEHER